MAPERTALAGVGAAGWANGNQTCKGTAPTLMPNAISVNAIAQSRTGAGVQCKDSAGTVVADTNCLAAERPADTQSCTAFCWQETTTPCTCAVYQAALPGVATIPVLNCRRMYNGTSQIVNDSQCVERYNVAGITDPSPSTVCPNPGYCNPSGPVENCIETHTTTSGGSSSGSSSRGFSGWVENNDGTRNYVTVSVGSNGQYEGMTVTPRMGNSGSYTTSLRTSSLNQLVAGNTTWAEWIAGGGGGGGGSSGGPPQSLVCCSDSGGSSVTKDCISNPGG